MNMLIVGTGRQDISSPFYLVSQGSDLTTATYRTKVFSFPLPVNFKTVKVFFEPLVSGDSITLKYDLARAGSFADTFEAAFSYSSSLTTFKLLNDEFEADDIQFQLEVRGSSQFPIVNLVVARIESQSQL